MTTRFCSLSWPRVVIALCIGRCPAAEWTTVSCLNADLEEPLRSFFQNHDLIHIVFGLNTDLHHEVLVDLWTFFGVDISLKDYLAYTRYPKVKETLRGPTFLEMLGTVKVLPKAMKVFFRARRLKKKWDWEPEASAWDTSLSTLRRDFGIELVQ